MIKQKKKTEIVWVCNLRFMTFQYVPEKVKKKDAEEAGIEFFDTKELAQEKCDKLNCI